MGCDIHTVIEEKIEGARWVGVAASDKMQKRPVYAGRDYEFFGKIANVRGTGEKYPRGLPRDLSELSWHLFMERPTDHHSASYMTIEEFCSIHNALRPHDSRSEYAVYDLTGISLEDGKNYRIVFWFDN